MISVKYWMLVSIIVIVLASATTFAGAPSCCQGKTVTGSTGQNIAPDSFWDVLTFKQQIKARELRSSYLEKIASLRAEYQQKRVELEALAVKEDYDDALVEKKIRKMFFRLIKKKQILGS